jgi:hypothetical protein
MTDAQRAKEWLEKDGVDVRRWEKAKRWILIKSARALTDAELIAFAREKGWRGEG